MLEARAHNQLKQLFENNASPWPHNLTLSRLVARTLRRHDNAFIELETGSQDFWWLGLLIPLCLDSSKCGLVLSPKKRKQLLNFELPRLQVEGFV